jgi:PAS domain S-box-containing protein
VDEVLGRSDFELFSPEAAAQVTASDQPVLLNGEHVSYVARLTTPVGPISALTVKVPYRDGDGRVIGVIGISRDISERAAAEEALKASEVRFRAIFDQAGIGISLVDAQGSVVQANAALQRMLGYSFEELAGRQLREFTYPEDAGIGWEYFQEMRAGLRDEYHVEKRYVRKDGRLVCGQLTVTAVRDAHGELQFAVGMVEDVTIRKRAEQRNAEFGVLGQRLNAASTPRQAAEIVLDAADRLLRWDCCWLELFAAGRKNATVMLSMDLVDGVRSDVTDLHAGQRISGLTLRAVERGGLLILRTPETMPAPAQPGHVFFGVPRPSASLMCVPIRTGDRFLGALSIQSYSFDAYTQEDVETLQALADYCTGAFERTQAESARRLLQEQLIQAQKMEAVGRLAGGVAHDFNNMLGVITGYCELLLDQPTLPETVRKPLGEVKKAGERAASLTRQLLAFSRKQMIQPQVLDLRAVVTSMDQMLHRLIGEDIQLITRLPRVLGSVMADPGQVEQVLMNLVLNARDAMPQGGTLTLELAEVTLDQPPSTPDGLTPGRYVCLTVADTGCGMDEETLPHLFEPFYTTKEVGKGTGLGLATVYGIVRQSDGYVAVDSAPGQGATFRIYLPRLEDPEPATVPTAAPGGAPRGSETILVAEDEEMLRRLVCTLLRAGGYQVLEAGSAEEALAQCSRHASPIHLLLTDVVMPGGSGRDLAVNALARHPGMKVIYMSGYTDDAVVRHGISSAEVHFLQKPFTAADLAQEVRRVLDGRGE